MQEHPLAAKLAETEFKPIVATSDMATGLAGIGVVLAGLLYRPKNLVGRVREGSNDCVVLVPSNPDVTLTGYGDDPRCQFDPATYGLQPCRCCRGERWRLAVSLLYAPGLECIGDDVLPLLSTDLMVRPSQYCLRDTARWRSRRLN